MQGYRWGEQPDDPNVIKLNTNELPFDPSPQVTQALRNFDPSILRVYPQPTADALRDQLAEHFELRRNNFIVTNGGDEALRLALTTFVEPGTTFAMTSPSYSLYPVLAQIQNANITEIPLGDDWLHPHDLAEQLNDAEAQLTCVVNPHAPSGQLTSAQDIEQLARTLEGVLLIDEAYVNFVDPQLMYNLVPLVNDLDNVLILRTFSKGYALAGLRLGYLIGHPALITPMVEKTRDSYNMDALSQIIGAAAFADHTYAQTLWQAVREARTQLTDGLRQLGFALFDSQTNFLLARIPGNAKLNAQQLYLALKDNGILVRYFDAPRLTDKLRITVGTTAQNQTLIEQLQELLT